MKIIKHKKGRNTIFPRLINELNLKIGVELGVQNGLYSEVLLRDSDITILYSIDSWTKEGGLPRLINNPIKVYLGAITRLMPYRNKSTIIRALTSEVVSLFKDNSLDFIYIDASHVYEDVKEDIANYYPKLKRGGVLAGHDYCEKSIKHNWFGVIPAVNEFAEQYGYHRINITRGRLPSWWVVKK